MSCVLVVTTKIRIKLPDTFVALQFISKRNNLGVTVIVQSPSVILKDNINLNEILNAAVIPGHCTLRLESKGIAVYHQLQI